jgi:hypothetical protein
MHLYLVIFLVASHVLPDAPKPQHDQKRLTPLILNAPRAEKKANWWQSKPMMVTWMAINDASLIVDTEHTQRCLHGKRCVESAFLFGRNPSRARVYAISVPIHGLVHYATYFLRKNCLQDGNADSCRWYPLFEWMYTGLHVAGRVVTP